MREIKFRAWDKQREEILPITLMDFNEWWVSCQPVLEYKVGPLAYGERNSFKNEETDRHILMQYTGLKDKNGKEIYEGDIVRFSDCYDCSSENGTDYDEFMNVGIIEYLDELPMFHVTNRNLVDETSVWEDIEVIGNIYENPELLEV